MGEEHIAILSDALPKPMRALFREMPAITEIYTVTGQVIRSDVRDAGIFEFVAAWIQITVIPVKVSNDCTPFEKLLNGWRHPICGDYSHVRLLVPRS